MTSKRIHDYLERLATLLRSQNRNNGAELGLQPVQMEALHYLSLCNRYSDTPMAVTEYLGQTKGTVSQSLKILEKKGLVSKHPDAQDKRVTHLKVTSQGKDFLFKTLPPASFVKSCDQLDQDSQKQLETGLHDLLLALQKSNNMKTFGLCHSCRHNQKKEDGSSFCLLTQEKLSADDTQKICREHESAC